MKKTKTISLILVCILITTMLFGCSKKSDQGNYTGKEMSIMNLTAAELISPRDAGQNPEAQVAAKGANDFAFALSSLLAEEAGDNNLVCSPFSVWLPLAALLNATDETNKPALLSALGASGITEEDINNAASRMLFNLTKLENKEYMDDFHNPIKIANAIFVDKSVTLKKEFAQTFLDYYRGSAINVDFSSSDAVGKVNQWASDNTEGLITNVIEEFDPETIAAIANAIYYSDRWDWEFNPDKTKEGDFNGLSGVDKANFMIREGDAQTYYEDDKVQAMPLSFANGGGLYIILPKDGDATKCLSDMTSDYFSEIQNDSIQATGKLLLPRFTIQGGVMDLSDSLQKMGVPLFDSDSAPLTGGIIEEDLKVWVNQAVQKAMIKVNEEGTTAAAVTVLAMAGAGMPLPTEPFEMICDKPFVFVLYDWTYDGSSQVLFTGVVNQVAEE